ncbi:MAG: hypothetical protein LWY06_05100 [Firmicutes bacterium]|nr:hypothetical protein [Bacillota bacterium]
MASTALRQSGKSSPAKEKSREKLPEAASSPEPAAPDENITNSMPFTKIMSQAGINSSLICSVIKDGLTASKKDEPDYSARFRYLELALQLLGIIPVEKKEAKSYDFTGKKYENFTDDELEAEYRARTEMLRFAPDRS